MKRKRTNLFFALSLLFALLSLFALILSRKSEAYASAFDKKICASFRSFLSSLSNRVPFSLFELFCVLSPAILVLFFYFLKKAEGKDALKCFLSMLGVFLLCFSVSVNTLFISYGKTSRFPVLEFSESEASFSLLYLRDKINFFDNPSYPEREKLTEKLYSAYSSLDFEELTLTGEVPRIKKIKNEALASRLGVLGNFSFLTAEISINLATPEYTSCFSSAHELAHLFGIASEGQASFFAYLASLETADAGIMYSAYLSAFEALFSELYAKNTALYSEIYASLSDTARSDLAEYRNFYYQYHGKITDNADKANGALIEFAAPDNDKGYSLFVNLIVAHISEVSQCN